MLYVGTDIVEIARVRKTAGRFPAFYDKILSPAEKSYCLGKADPVPSLAGCFAAKEAVLKCIGTGLSGLSWRDLEIIHDQQGAPQVSFSEKLQRVLGQKRINGIKVSISHSRDYAVAVAVGEGEADEDNNRF